MIIKHLSLHMVNAESIRCNEKDLLAMWECGLKTQTHTEVLHWQSKRTTYQFFLWSRIKRWREPASSCGSSVRVFWKREKERVRETLIIFHLKQSTYRPLFGHFKFIGICRILCPINKVPFCQFPNLPIASSMRNKHVEGNSKPLTEPFINLLCIRVILVPEWLKKLFK